METGNALDNVIVTTTNDLPGYEVVQVLGDVFGLIVTLVSQFSLQRCHRKVSSERTLVGFEQCRREVNRLRKTLFQRRLEHIHRIDVDREAHVCAFR